MTPGGTGSRFGGIVVTWAGLFALASTVVGFVSIWLQLKNYRKPFLQRHVVRILLMVPIYAVASWVSLISITASRFVDPVRDVYEAFTIYTFVQLLASFLGGERSLITLTFGRRPTRHLWPLNHVLPKVDISDPHTFLAIKRGILQYAWLKPILAVATIVMKATHTYQEGYIGWTSGYFWSGLIYNVSITICLYALAMFWACMFQDLAPFRPMPKFLSIKGVIFASYWQGFFLSLLVWLGAIPDDVPGYTPDNLAAAIQDALICFEMLGFAIGHWYAFSWYDYKDNTVASARLPVKYALRDAFGIVDLIEDTKQTFLGDRYQYRNFGVTGSSLAHEESTSRQARMKAGMRFERGRGTYWLPQPGRPSERSSLAPRTLSMAEGQNSVVANYGSLGGGPYDDDEIDDSPWEDDENEGLYSAARELEFGDYNYPVVTAHIPTAKDLLYTVPRVITPSTHNAILNATGPGRVRRKTRIEELRRSAAGSSEQAPRSSKSKSKDKDKGKRRAQSPQAEANKAPNPKTNHSNDLIDLVVEDEEAEQIDRVVARKSADNSYNQEISKHYVRTYPSKPNGIVEEEVLEANAPERVQPKQPYGEEQLHNVDQPYTRNDPNSEENRKKDAMWETRQYGDDGEESQQSLRVGRLSEDQNVWAADDDDSR